MTIPPEDDPAWRRLKEREDRWRRLSPELDAWDSKNAAKAAGAAMGAGAAFSATVLAIIAATSGLVIAAATWRSCAPPEPAQSDRSMDRSATRLPESPATPPLRPAARREASNSGELPRLGKLTVGKGDLSDKANGDVHVWCRPFESVGQATGKVPPLPNCWTSLSLCEAAVTDRYPLGRSPEFESGACQPVTKSLGTTRDLIFSCSENRISNPPMRHGYKYMFSARCIATTSGSDAVFYRQVSGDKSPFIVIPVEPRTDGSRVFRVVEPGTSARASFAGYAATLPILVPVEVLGSDGSATRWLAISYDGTAALPSDLDDWDPSTMRSTTAEADVTWTVDSTPDGLRAYHLSVCPSDGRCFDLDTAIGPKPSKGD